MATLLAAAGHRPAWPSCTSATPTPPATPSELQRDVASGGGRVVAALEYDGRATDFSGLAGQVAAAHPQAVVVIGAGEAAAVVKALVDRRAGPDVAPLYVSDLALWPGLVQGLTPAQAAGVTGVRPGAAPSRGVPGAARRSRPPTSPTRATRRRRTTRPSWWRWRRSGATARTGPDRRGPAGR